MSMREIKNAVNNTTGELIYFKGHAKATFMSDGSTVEDAIKNIKPNIDLSDYVKSEELEGYAKTEDIPSLEGYAKSDEIPSLDGYVKTEDIPSLDGLGAFLATLGVVLPSFIIILLIATLLTKLLKYAGVKATLKGIRPAIVGMILATALTMFLSVVFQIKTVRSVFVFDWKSLCIFGAIALGYFGYKQWRKKPVSPILLIVFSGILGVVFFGI